MPDVQVFDGATELADGATLSFGTTWSGIPVTRTVKVKNGGTSTIMLTPLDPQAMPAGFELVFNFGKTTLAANASTTFTVQLTSVSNGTYHGPISLASSDMAGPFDLILDGQVSAARVIDDGDSAFKKVGVWTCAMGKASKGMSGTARRAPGKIKPPGPLLFLRGNTAWRSPGRRTAAGATQRAIQRV